MLDEFLKILYLIFFVAVNVSEQGVLPKSGLLKPYKNDLQEGGDTEVVIPPDCLEMCDEAGCIIYCPEPARGVKRCTAKSSLNKRFCCSTDGPLAPVFNLPPRPGGELSADPLIPTYPSLLNYPKKLPALTPLLDSKLTEIKNSLTKLKSLRTDIFRRKKSQGQNYIKSNPCDKNYQSTSNEEIEIEKCQDPVHLTFPSALLSKSLKNVKEIILPNYEQKEISTSEIDSITNPETGSNLDEDHNNFKTLTRILDKNNHQIQSLNTRKYHVPDETSGMSPAFQTSDDILHKINNNDPKDSTTIIHPSSDINILLNSKDVNNISLLLPEITNVHESSTNNNEIISVTEFPSLGFQSDPHFFEPIYIEGSTPLKKYEQTFLNDATVNKYNYSNSRTDSQENEPKLSTKTVQENIINLIDEEKLPIQKESKYENNEYKTVYSRYLSDPPLNSKFNNTERIAYEQKPFNKPENLIMGTVHDNDSTMINVPTNTDKNSQVNVPKSNMPENISNEFDALYFEDNVADREKLLIPLSQVLGNVKSRNTQIKEIHSQDTNEQETQGYQNFQPYRTNDLQRLYSEIGEKHPQQTENIGLDYIPIEPGEKKEFSSHDTTYYEEHPMDVGTVEIHDEKSNIGYLQKTNEGIRGVKLDVENIKNTILNEEPHSVRMDVKFIADDPLFKYSNDDNKEKSESQEVIHKSDTAHNTRPLISESITDDVNLYSRINEEQSVETSDVYGLENDGSRGEHTRLPNNVKSITEVPLFKYSINNYERNSEHQNVNYNLDTVPNIRSPIAEIINDEAHLHTDIDGQQIIDPSEANVVENKKNSIETSSIMNEEHINFNQNVMPIRDHSQLNIPTSSIKKNYEYKDNMAKRDSEGKIKQLMSESTNDGKNSYVTAGSLQSAVANNDYGVKNDKKSFGASEMSNEGPSSLLQGELPFANIEDILFNFSKNNKKDKVNVYSDIFGEQSVLHGDIIGVENKRDIIETFGKHSEENGSLRQNVKPLREHPLFNIPTRNNKEDTYQKEVISNSVSPPTISLLPPQFSESINDEVNVYSETHGDQPVMPSDINGVKNITDAIEAFGRHSEEHGSHRQDLKLISEHPLFNMPTRSNKKDAEEKHVITNSDNLLSISPLPPQISESTIDKVDMYSDIDGDQTVLLGDAVGEENPSDVIHTSGKHSGEHSSGRPLISEHPLFNVTTRSNEEDSRQKHVISNSDTPPTISLLPPQFSESINDEVNVYSETYGDQPVMLCDTMGEEKLSDVMHTSGKHSGEHGSLSQDVKLITEHPYNILTRSIKENSEEKHVISNSDTLFTISPLPPQIPESINDEENVLSDIDGVQLVTPSDINGVVNITDSIETFGKHSGEHGSLRQDVELITENPLFNIPTRSNEENTIEKHVISNSDTPPTINLLPPQISESINDEVNVYSDIDQVQSVLPIDTMEEGNLSDVMHTSGKHSREHGSLRQDVELITEHPLFNIPTRSKEENTMEKHVISNSDTPPTISLLPPQISESINDEVNVYSDIDQVHSVLPIDTMEEGNLSDVMHTSGKHSREHGSLRQDVELITEHPLFNIPTRSKEENTMEKHVISNSDTPPTISLLPPQISESINDEVNVYSDIDQVQSVLPIDTMEEGNLSDVMHTSGKHSGEHGSLRQDVELITEHPLYNIPTRSNEENTMEKHVISNSDTPPTISPLPPQISESINDEVYVYNDIDQVQSVLPIDTMEEGNLSDVMHASSKHSGEHGSLRQDVDLNTEHPLYNIPTRSNEEDSEEKHVLSNSDTSFTISPLPPKISKATTDKLNVLSDIDREQSGFHSDTDVKNVWDIIEAAGEHSGEHVNFIQDVHHISDHPSSDIPTRIKKEDAEKNHVIYNSNTPTTIGPQPALSSFNDRINLNSATDEHHTSGPSDDFGLENYRDTSKTSSRISGEHTNLSSNRKYISDYSFYNITNNSNKIKSENEHASDSVPNDRVIDQPVLPSNIYGEKKDSDTIEYSGFSQNIRSIRGQSLLKVSNSSNIENSLTEDVHDKSEIVHIIRPQMSESFNDDGEILYGTLDGDKTSLHSDGNNVENHQNTFGSSGRHSGEYTSLRNDVNPITNYPIINFRNSGTKNNEMNEEVIDKSYTSSLPSLISESNNVKVNYSDVNEEQFIMPSDVFGVENKRNTIEKFAKKSGEPASFSQIGNPVTEHPLFNIPNRSYKNNSNNDDLFDESNIPPTVSPLISDSSNDNEDLYSTIVGDQVITNGKKFITNKYFNPMNNIHNEVIDFKIPKISPNIYAQKRRISQDEEEISNKFISRSNVEKLEIERQNKQQDLSVVQNPTNNEVNSKTHIVQQASSDFGVTNVKNRGLEVNFDGSVRKKVDEENRNVFSSYAPLLNALEGIPSTNIEKSIKYSPEINDRTYGSSINFENKLYELNNSTDSNNSQSTTNNEYVDKYVSMEKLYDHEENAKVESFQFSQQPKNVDTSRKSESESYNLFISNMDDVRPDIIVADLTQNQDVYVNNQEFLNIENVLNNVDSKKLEAIMNDEVSPVNIPVLTKPVESETCSCKSESSSFNFPEESSRGLLIGNLINRMNPRSPIHIFIDGDRGIITPERVSLPSKSELSNTKIAHVISERNIENPKNQNTHEFVNGQYVRMRDNEYNNLNENNNEALLDIQKTHSSIHLSYPTSPEHLPTPELRESITRDGISTFQNQQQLGNQGPLENGHNGFIDLVKSGQYISQPNEFYTKHPSSSETGYYTPVPIYIYIRTK